MKTKELRQKLSRLESRAHKLMSDIQSLISELDIETNKKLKSDVK